jgi:hypothetical protein
MDISLTLVYIKLNFTAYKGNLRETWKAGEDINRRLEDFYA